MKISVVFIVVASLHLDSKDVVTVRPHHSIIIGYKVSLGNKNELAHVNTWVKGTRNKNQGNFIMNVVSNPWKNLV